MKNIFLALGFFLFLGSVAQAAPYRLYPQIYFPQPVYINNVCTSGDFLRTINPVKVCLKVEIVNREACAPSEGQDICRVLKNNEEPKGMEVLRETAACVESQFAQLETPVKYDSHDCTQWTRATGRKNPECVSWVPVVRSWPATYSVEVVDNDGDQSFRSHGRVDYKLPFCLGGKR